jgi:DNA-binding transcriptional ArsR family regulator
MLPNLDPLLHSQLRLQIISLLVGLDSADFNHILEKTSATRGNVSVQLNKLKQAGYITIKKSFGESYPITKCSITQKGITAFEEYVEAIKVYLDSGKS